MYWYEHENLYKNINKSDKWQYIAVSYVISLNVLLNKEKLNIYYLYMLRLFFKLMVFNVTLTIFQLHCCSH